MKTLDWQELQPLLDTLSVRVIARAGGDSGERGVQVYGVPRGGAVLASLLDVNHSGITQVFNPHDADVIVDDLVDSGHTMEKWSKQYPGTPFEVLITKEAGSPYAGEWIEFPWESGTTDRDMEENVIRLLEHWGEDPTREGLRETPKRYLKGMGEMLKGYREDPAEHLRKHFDISDVEATRYDQVIISKNIPFVSFCEHHLMPFFGEAHIGYLPQEESAKVVGLSKLARCVEGFATRLQVQERMTRQIHDAINDVLEPAGSMVLIEGTHTCQCWRGVKKDGVMMTSAIGGVFRDDPAARGEVLALFKA